MRMPPVKVLPSRKDTFQNTAVAKYVREEENQVQTPKEKKQRNPKSMSVESKRTIQNPITESPIAGKKQRVKSPEQKSPKQGADTTSQILNVFWFKMESANWKPELRESSAFSFNGRHGYMFGGLGKEIYDDLHIFDCGNN
jgi:hypothetical protein